MRKLVGIETSGSLNILFADKTGTLTRGRLKVASFVCGDGSEHNSFSALKRKRLWSLWNCPVYSTPAAPSPPAKCWRNATDRALIRFISPASPSLRGEYIKKALSLDSAYKFSAATIIPKTKIPAGRQIVLIKGAPEITFLTATGILTTAAKQFSLKAGCGSKAK